MKYKTGKRPPRVLVIEDNFTVRRMLRISLRSAGFDITEAQDGTEGLRELEAVHPEAVILNLGVSDGASNPVLDRLRQLEKTSDQPPAWVVISTLDQEEITQSYGPLPHRFIPKPFNPWELIASLESQIAAARLHRQ